MISENFNFWSQRHLIEKKWNCGETFICIFWRTIVWSRPLNCILSDEIPPAEKIFCISKRAQLLNRAAAAALSWKSVNWSRKFGISIMGNYLSVIYFCKILTFTINFANFVTARKSDSWDIFYRLSRRLSNISQRTVSNRCY